MIQEILMRRVTWPLLSQYVFFLAIHGSSIAGRRLFETKKLLGFFWAANHNELWWTIDAVSEPSAYEWTRLRSGGLHYDEGKERDMSDLLTSDSREDDDNPEGDEPAPLDGLELHEDTWGDLNNEPKCGLLPVSRTPS